VPGPSAFTFLAADQQNQLQDQPSFNDVSLQSLKLYMTGFVFLTIITDRNCWSPINNRKQKTKQSTNNKSVIKASQRAALARTDARSVHAVLEFSLVTLFFKKKKVTNNIFKTA
jgi:hypothetical protein